MTLPRYPAYKDTGVPWLGELPEHWSLTRLKNALFLKQNTVGSRADEFLLLSLTLKGVIPRDLENPQGKFPSSFETYQAVDEGDLVFCLFDVEETPRTVGVSRHAGMVTGAYTVAQAKCDFIPEFLFYYYYARDQYKAWRMYYTGLRNVIRWDNFCDIPCLVPPKGEQAAIANFLDRETAKIDALIAEQEKLIALLAEKRQATISHAVTQGLDPNAPMRDSGVAWLGEVPAHWEAVRVKALSQFTTSGPRGWSDRIAEYGSLFIQSGDLNDSLGLDYGTAKRVDVGDDAEAARTRLCEGDVVVCITGAKTGNVALCSSLCEPAYVNQHLCLIRPNEDVHGRFLAFALKSTVGQTQLEVSQYGLKQGLSLESVRETWVARPPRDEQHAVVEFLDEELGKFASLALAADIGISLLKERRSALIAAAVTGQIDVRTLHRED